MSEPKLIIGVDLDHTIYGHPEFFREFIPAMIDAGHSFVCTSWHTRQEWEDSDRIRLVDLGLNPVWISTDLLRQAGRDYGNPARSSSPLDSDLTHERTETDNHHHDHARRAFAGLRRPLPDAQGTSEGLTLLLSPPSFR